MTDDLMNQTSEVLTDFRMLAVWTQRTGPSPRSKCTVQLPSLNLVNRMCLSNSDFEVQSAGYNSAQSPTNWESIHGKDPSILCRASSRLPIALDDKTQNAKSKIVRWHEKFITIFMQCVCVCVCVKLGELAISTLQVLRGQGSCLSKNIEYEMFLPDIDVCLNFTCIRWHHHISNIVWYWY